MEALKLLYDEESVNKIAQGVLDSVKEKIKDQIANETYDRLEGYLYEHYENNKDKIRCELIREISDDFTSNPSNYKFTELRTKIFHEHHDEIIKALTDQAILVSMENILCDYTHRDYTFNWKWKDGIVALIMKNWDLFRDDERIMGGFGREIERLKSRIGSLENQIREISEVVKED